VSGDVHAGFCERRGVRLPPATLLLAICQTRRDAEGALEALRAILAELGLELKAAKTRIVHLREGGEGVDFLGFHHRYVRGHTQRSWHLTFLVRWPSRQAMGHARQRIREITARSRLRVPVEVIVRELNRFLRGWAGYFRYGNSAQFFDKITLHALRRWLGSSPSVRSAGNGMAGGLSLTRQTAWV